ncbi:MAG: hypothetical protein PUF06_09005 [Veillonellaceae bacterium]|nr:hypothetical protein [Veillonellaceae bacterium]
MFTILYHLKNRYLSQKAQGIVEYALILAFVVAIAIFITSGNNNLSDAIKGVFTDTANQVKGTGAGAGAAGGNGN